MLTREQVDGFHQDGYLFLDEFYPTNAIESIRKNLPEVLNQRDERVVFEKGGKTVRSVYGVHQINRVFATLARHKDIAETAQELLDGQVYVYQSKLNVKSAFDGDIWDWHQDYIYWQTEDAMPTARVITVALFLDDVTEFNSPIIVVPGSHCHGVLKHTILDRKPVEYMDRQDWITTLTASLKYTVDRSVLTEQIKAHGMIAKKGKAGSILVFDGNTVHASLPNISPCERSVLLYTYNRVDNAPPVEKLYRPSFLASRDSTPIEPIATEIRAIA
ncbi:MAG: phytanoyl-CoA dioxygenase family protein [Myxococcales bacterium]|nr:phytanoyl-CoA dioxygenase family protein [Myxococcales bacterium]